jgi:hypothetical protein
MVDRNAVLAHAEQYWFRPCEDGDVWLNNAPIKVRNKMTELRLSPSEWDCVFLQDNSWKDHLFAVRKHHVPNLSALRYNAANIPATDRVKIQDWAGLNDCSHFVSECLRKGGFSNGSLSVGPLVDNLLKSGSVKLLTDLVSLADARAVLGAGIVKAADIIAYGADDGSRFNVHGHAVIVQEIGAAAGAAQVAVVNHTRLNHKSFNGVGGGADNWTEYAAAATKHPLVSILHFSHDDPSPMSSRNLHGWWEITWRNAPYYYRFETDGTAVWSRRRPASAAAPSFSVSLDGKGNWFHQPRGLTVIWQSSASVEQYSVVRDPINGRYEIDGSYCGAERIRGVQLM